MCLIDSTLVKDCGIDFLHEQNSRYNLSILLRLGWLVPPKPPILGDLGGVPGFLQKG